ncbi:MAG: hypothetical protein DRJ08_02825 [Acidobacteria bacterium]|nr:MAG: hypothetical protein DRJ14_05540 [Acidobacteriota bacterium]RLE23251.1 MAG: hypothetical protein DRJ08_02825 [Acidobacteriota bacterium]
MAPENKELRHHKLSTYARVERFTGGLLLAIGAILLIFDSLLEGFYSMTADTSMPLSYKLAVLGVAIGLVLLLISVFRESLFFRNHERYKDIER